MAKKLTQEDLKYINNLTAYAIQNPEWFWSDADDASNARQYLYGVGGAGIVDEIYQETPDNIKKTISNKKLSRDASFNKFHEEWKDKQEDAAKVVAGTLAASAAAPFAIGGLTSAASTGALSNAGRYALGKADDAVAWLSKSGTKVYDPRHIVQTLLNPTKAYTGAGQAVASTLDVAGAAQGLKHANDTVKEWGNGNFQVSDVPQVALDLAGTLPAINYFKQIGVSVPRILTTMYDNTSSAFNNMRNGVEPAYGIRASILDPDQFPELYHPDLYADFRSQQAAERLNEQLRGIHIDDVVTELPEPPSEVTIDLSTDTQNPVRPAWSGLSVTTLPSSTMSRLRQLGLGRYDVQNLLDRGFTPEQLESFAQIDASTPGLTFNPRANALARRLSEAGIQPASQSRMQYLQDLQNQGAALLQNEHGRPMSFEEFVSDPNTTYLDPFDYQLTNEELIDYYTSEIPVNRRRLFSIPELHPQPIAHSIYNSPDYSEVIDKLNHSVVTLDDETFMQVSPKIQQIIENGYTSGMAPQEMENQLSALFAQYDRPFFNLPTIHGRTRVSADAPIRDLKSIFDPTYRHGWNVPWRITPYTIDNVPFRVDPTETRVGYKHWSMFNSDADDIAQAKASVFKKTPHGGLTFESNKSLQSSPVAHQDYARKAMAGEGVVVFVPSDNGSYLTLPTNDYAGTVMSPTELNGRVNAPSMVKTFRNNIGRWRQLFENVDPRAFEPFGGVAPDIRVDVDGSTFVLKPQFSDGRFIGFTGEDDALRATEALDQKIMASRQPRLDAARQNYESAIAQAQAQSGIELPEGVTWVMTSSGPKLQFLQTSGNFKGQIGVDSIENYMKINPHLQNDPKWVQLRNTLDNIKNQYVRDQLFDTYVGRFSITQPVAGFRKFNRGGIIKTLNKNIAKLLNI